MRTLLAFIITFLVITPAFASRYLNDASMKNINLNGVRIIDDEGMDTLMWRFGAMRSVLPEIQSLIEQETGSAPLSRVWGLIERSSFKNIFIFVTKDDVDGYELNVLYWNKSGSTFLVDYKITGATKKELKLENGPSDEIQKLRLIGSGPLF